MSQAEETSSSKACRLDSSWHCGKKKAGEKARVAGAANVEAGGTR